MRAGVISKRKPSINSVLEASSFIKWSISMWSHFFPLEVVNNCKPSCTELNVKIKITSIIINSQTAVKTHQYNAESCVCTFV